MESLSLESSEEELEEEEDEEELVDEDVPEEEVLAFFFFLSFPSFFFSAIHKERVSGAALVLQKQRCWFIPLPAWFLSCLEFPSVATFNPGCSVVPGRGAQDSALVRTRPKWA